MKNLTNSNLKAYRDIPIAKILNKPEGRRIKICCPLDSHNDKTPSFCVFPDNGFKCFGCDAKGSGAIDFAMAMGFDFKQALEELENYL